MNNIYEDINTMRQMMKMMGCTKEEIENASKEVTSAESYEQAQEVIKKYYN